MSPCFCLAATAAEKAAPITSLGFGPVTGKVRCPPARPRAAPTSCGCVAQLAYSQGTVPVEASLDNSAADGSFGYAYRDAAIVTLGRISLRPSTTSGCPGTGNQRRIPRPSSGAAAAIVRLVEIVHTDKLTPSFSRQEGVPPVAVAAAQSALLLPRSASETDE